MPVYDTTIMTDSATDVLSPPDRERVYRRNFPWFLADSLLFTLALAIISATTIIPDFLRRLTDNEILIGLSGSLFTIGFTLPQLFVARYIVRSARKKWWFVGPNIVVRPVILLLAILTAWLGDEYPARLLVVFFLCYSLAAFGDGLVGVPWADLAGTSLDNRWRARVFGFTSAATGVLMLLLAPLIGAVLSERGPPFPANYALLFGAAGVLFVVSIVPGLFFRELPGGTAQAQLPAFGVMLSDLLGVLRADGPFRAFIIARSFTSLFMMAAPFYIGYATVQLGLSSAVAVPVLLAMQTIGGIVGALLFTWLGARSNLLYIRLALIGSALLPICALLAGAAGPLPLYVGFLVSGLATTDLAFGFLNWVVGYVDADHRPLYVGLSNTVAAVVSLISPFIAGTIVERLGYRPLFVVALVMALSALVVTLRFMREPEPHDGSRSSGSGHNVE